MATQGVVWPADQKSGLCPAEGGSTKPLEGSESDGISESEDEKEDYHLSTTQIISRKDRFGRLARQTGVFPLSMLRVHVNGHIENVHSRISYTIYGLVLLTQNRLGVFLFVIRVSCIIHRK
jgi:hypothetical protein